MKNTDERRRRPKNTETLAVDLGKRERRLTEVEGVAERRRVFSDQIRLMQRPLLEQRRKSTAAVALEYGGDARKTIRRRGTKWEKEK